MLLELRAVSRSFGGLKAVQGLSLAVPKNTLSALIGPNGAGKTTVFSLMSGFLKPDQGQVLFKGARHHGTARPRVCQARPHPDLSNCAALCQPDGEREHRSRCALAFELAQRRLGLCERCGRTSGTGESVGSTRS